LSAIAWLLVLVCVWLAIALASALAVRRLRLITHALLPLGAATGVAIAAVALLVTGTSGVQRLVLPLGLPDLPFHFRLDALSAFFLLLLGAVASGVSIFAVGYMRHGGGSTPGLQSLNYHVFLAAMALVFLADDAYSFMVAWETMALSSFFLVTTDHRNAEIRSAGYLYLLIAHLGALAILLSFGVLHGTGDYTFDSMRNTTLSPTWATIGFLLALLGFGGKAGIVPLHVWLPEAHPAAPSPVSALMSAVMLKTAIYGLLRVTFDLLQERLWWWGVVVLSGLFGAVFSAVQSDMKRLLAYSSIENIGLILSGIGLSIIFYGFGMPALAAIALLASFYHSLNHAFFKSLLFLSTGAVLHATRERALGKLGGLIHSMPWVAWVALIGTLAIAGLPPLNGFVSEWLLLQAFLFTPDLPQGYLNMLVPVAAAAITLTSALAGYVMVKFFGIVFLGQRREERLAEAKDAGWWERIGLVWLAVPCVLLGLLPVQAIDLMDDAVKLLVQHDVSSITRASWLYLAPIEPARASYSPTVLLVLIALVTFVAWLVVRSVFHGAIHRGPPWDCGFPGLNARMQDTAEGFGQPIRVVFEPFFQVERELPTPFDTQPRYRLGVGDRFWAWIYQPIARAVESLIGVVAVLQRGRISVYLTYTFVTLLVLLLFAR
jgi:formate hydrogenlyase subunit 3/multisubunit Na+/H+ antiporter MnhD subunit